MSSSQLTNEEAHQLHCARCGTANPKDHKFCANCGAPLSSQTNNTSRHPPRWAIVILTIGCLIALVSTFFQWSDESFGPEVICGFGLWPLILAMVCLGLTYIEITRNRFSKATALAQVIMGMLATIPWISHSLQFIAETQFLTGTAEPEPGFALAGVGLLMWLLGAMLGWGNRSVSAVGVFLVITLFAIVSSLVWWKVSGKEAWFHLLTEPRLTRVARDYREALLAGDWDRARSMYCTVDCLEDSYVLYSRLSRRQLSRTSERRRSATRPRKFLFTPRGSPV